MIWKKFLSYLNIFGKKQPGARADLNLRMMHGINRISIIMFLGALIFWLIRFVF